MPEHDETTDLADTTDARSRQERPSRPGNWILAILILLAILVVAGVWILSPAEYRAEAFVQVKSPNPRVPQQLEQPLIEVELLNRYVADQMTAIKQVSVLSETLKSADVTTTDWYRAGRERVGVEALLNELKEDLLVEQVTNTNYIRISFATRKPKDAPRIVNGVVDKYLSEVESQAKTRYGVELEHYKQKEAELERRLNLNRTERLDAIARMPMSGVTEGPSGVGETVRALAAEVSQLEATKLHYKAQYDNLRTMSPDQNTLSLEQQEKVQADPTIIWLSQRKLVIEIDLEANLPETPDNQSEVAKLRKELAAVDKKLDEIVARRQNEIREATVSAVETLYLNAAQAQIQIQEQLVNQEANLKDIDRRLVEYRAKEEEHERLEEQYNQLSAFNRQLEMMIRDRGMVRVYRGGIAQVPVEPDFDLQLGATIVVVAVPVIYAILLVFYRVLARRRHYG